MSSMLLVAFVFVLLSVSTNVFDDSCRSNIIVKPKIDEREYKYSVLENGLGLVTVSDNETKVSAATLVVEAGSFFDPNDSLGMAHFLEHMIFMGTEKYPDEGDFGSFIRNNFGQRNGWTEDDSTTYYFSIVSNQFEPALDRFSRFFYEPLLKENSIEREMEAVHSEYEMDLPNDYWRRFLILKELSSPTNHPFSKFTIGNLDTLSHDNIRDRVVDFFETYYSSSLMYLSIYGPEPTDVLQDWGRKYFSKIKKLNRSRSVYEGTIFHPPNMKHKMIQIVPLREYRQLRLIFPVDGYTFKNYKNDSLKILNHLFSSQATGSFYRFLVNEKKPAWITSLSSGMGQSWEGQGLWKVDFSLTKEGEKHVEEIIGMVFEYVSFILQISESELQRIFEEASQLAEIDFEFQGEARPSQTTNHLTRSMKIGLNPEDFLRGYEFPYHFDFSKFQNDVESLFDVNLMITLWTSQIHQVKSDGGDISEDFKKEKYMGGEYRTVELSNDLIQYCSLGRKIIPRSYFTVPKTNEFVPQDLSIKSFSTDHEKELNKHPRLIYEDERMKVYYKQDTQFNRPKSYFRIRFHIPNSNKNAKNVILTNIFAKLVAMNLKNVTNYASDASLGFLFVGDEEGIELIVNGWSDPLFKLFDLFMTRFTRFDSFFDENHFEMIKEEMIRHFANYEINDPYSIGIYTTRHVLMYSPTFHYRDLLQETKTLSSIDEVRKFYKEEFLNEGARFTILAMGNHLEEEIREDMISMKILQNDFLVQTPSIGEEDINRKQVIKMEESSRYVLFLKSPNVNDTVNNALIYNFQVGLRNQRLDIMSSLLGAVLSPMAFDELRSTQQLGYVVSFRFILVHNVYHAQFVIQSDKYDPTEMSRRVRKFLHEYRVRLEEEKLTQDFFDQQIQMHKKKYEKKLKSLAEEGRFDWTEIIDGTFRFDRKKEYGLLLDQENQETKFVTKEDIMKLYDDIFLDETRSEFEVQVFAEPKWNEFKGKRTEYFDEEANDSRRVENLHYGDNFELFSRGKRTVDEVYPSFVEY